jgi:hypothetical protein
VPAINGLLRHWLGTANATAQLPRSQALGGVQLSAEPCFVLLAQVLGQTPQLPVACRNKQMGKCVPRSMHNLAFRPIVNRAVANIYIETERQGSAAPAATAAGAHGSPKGTGGCAPPPPPPRATGVGRRDGEARSAQDELHSAAQARAWADGGFYADHGFGLDGVGHSALEPDAQVDAV